MLTRRFLISSTLAGLAGVCSSGQEPPRLIPGIVRLQDLLQGEMHAPNTVFSPTSIFLALSMTAAGARRETEAQMYRVLGQQPSAGFHGAVQQLARTLSASAGDAELGIANRLWVEKSYPLLPGFLAITSKHYEAEATPASFVMAAEPERLLINRWVAERTKGKIKDLFPPRSFNPDTRIVLANAIYFKGRWENPFPRQATKPMPFHTGAGQKNVPMMSRLGPYRYAETGLAQMVELPYSGSTLTMMIVLPKQRNGLAALEITTRGKASAMPASARTEELLLSLPRFKVESSVDLKPILSKLGMAGAFDRGANFTGMSLDRKLYISGSFHSAFLEVNEAGAEAAAGTGVALEVESARRPMAVTVDHPFLFFIRDTKSGAILFSGRVSDPANQ